ncbi:MAG: catechol 2,3-dioxygenase-like lactoylglutathione lyase family enzyme [Cognaticolwellia sp.]|jgi:catechol 2,3-dioxygenase-like lactoylglutathione lyase family enzyme
MSVFTHVTVGTKDLNKARAFYDNVLSILGLKRIADLDENGSIWGLDSPSFFVLKPANGQRVLVMALQLASNHLTVELPTLFTPQP